MPGLFKATKAIREVNTLVADDVTRPINMTDPVTDVEPMLRRMQRSTTP